MGPSGCASRLVALSRQGLSHGSRIRKFVHAYQIDTTISYTAGKIKGSCCSNPQELTLLPTED